MLGRSRIGIVVGLLAIAACATIAHDRATINELQESRAELALARTNDSAAIAQTVRVSDSSAKLARVLGDSLALYQRQVVQVAQRSDAVDRALQLERRGKYALSLSVDSLHRVVAARSPSAVDSTNGARMSHAEFQVRQAPYTVAAAIDVPQNATDTAQLTLRIALDPIPVTARLSCAPANADGIRTASIEAATPRWATIQFRDVEQSPDLCASPALTKIASRRWVRPAIVAGVGKVTTGDGELHWGAFAGVGFAFGT